MLILGIDPGTATTGYGLVKIKNRGKPELINWGLIETENNGDASRRLNEIYGQTLKLLRVSSPDVVAIERLFFYTNAKTAMRVGQAHGIFLLAAARHKTPVFEYAPGQIKLRVAGNGRADKSLMKKTIRKLFGIRAPKRGRTHFDNVADAIAVAVCHAQIVHNKKNTGKREGGESD